MELKVKSITFPEVIEFNFEELKQEVIEKSAAYLNLVYTDGQISEAKNDRSNLNKFVKALSEERIKIKKQCLIPYEDFERKINELAGIVNESIKNIDSQIKAAEEKKKTEKLNQIKEYWDRVTSPDHPLKLGMVMDSRWTNSSVSMKSIQDSINSILSKYAEDISTLRDLPEYSFEAIEVYNSTLDLSKAVNESHRLREQAKRKEEYKAKEKNEINQEKIPEKEGSNTEPLKEWLSFRALLTVDDALALRDFFLSKKIEFEQI